MRTDANRSGHGWWSGLAAVLIALAAAGVWVGLLWRQQIAFREKSQSMRSELARLDSIGTAPSDDEFARARANLNRLKASFPVARPIEPATPEDTRELYFAIARFVEDMRAAARAARIDLRAREKFGFAAYAEHPPEPGMLRTVTHQLAEIRRILAALVAARPTALHAVRRAANSPARTESAAAAEDFFVPDSEAVPRPAGASPPDVFLVEFTGDTAALRRFLQALAEGEQPAVVRAVSVTEHRPKREKWVSPERDAAGGAIASGLSRFTVTIEVLENDAREAEKT